MTRVSPAVVSMLTHQGEAPLKTARASVVMPARIIEP